MIYSSFFFVFVLKNCNQTHSNRMETNGTIGDIRMFIFFFFFCTFFFFSCILVAFVSPTEELLQHTNYENIKLILFHFSSPRCKVFLIWCFFFEKCVSIQTGWVWLVGQWFCSSEAYLQVGRNCPTTYKFSPATFSFFWTRNKLAYNFVQVTWSYQVTKTYSSRYYVVG